MPAWAGPLASSRTPLNGGGGRGATNGDGFQWRRRRRMPFAGGEEDGWTSTMPPSPSSPRRRGSLNLIRMASLAALAVVAVVGVISISSVLGGERHSMAEILEEALPITSEADSGSDAERRLVSTMPKDVHIVLRPRPNPTKIDGFPVIIPPGPRPNPVSIETTNMVVEPSWTNKAEELEEEQVVMTLDQPSSTLQEQAQPSATLQEQKRPTTTLQDQAQPSTTLQEQEQPQVGMTGKRVSLFVDRMKKSVGIKPKTEKKKSLFGEAALVTDPILEQQRKKVPAPPRMDEEETEDDTPAIFQPLPQRAGPHDIRHELHRVNHLRMADEASLPAERVPMIMMASSESVDQAAASEAVDQAAATESDKTEELNADVYYANTLDAAENFTIMTDAEGGEIRLPHVVFDKHNRPINLRDLVNEGDLEIYTLDDSSSSEEENSEEPDGDEVEKNEGSHHEHDWRKLPGEVTKEIWNKLETTTEKTVEKAQRSAEEGPQAQDQMVIVWTVATMALLVGALSARRLRSRQFLSRCIENESLEDELAYDTAYTTTGGHGGYNTFSSVGSSGSWRGDLEKFDV